MADHNANALGAAVKALTQVVAPSVDPGNPLAVEQLRLVAMYLEVFMQQRPHQRRLAWTDLHLQCELARQVAALLESALTGGCERLKAVAGVARHELDHPTACEQRWEQLHAELSACLSQVMAEVSAGPHELRDALDRLVLAHAEHQLLLHRVWFRAYGFEARPDSLPSLETLLSVAPDI